MMLNYIELLAHQMSHNSIRFNQHAGAIRLLKVSIPG